jgi:hypothetical protein
MERFAEVMLECTHVLIVLPHLLPLIPPRLDPERQQDLADDHHAFDSDAKPGDLSLQLLPIRSFNSSKKFRMT